MKEGLVDSMVLMHYDNGHEEAIDWWERMLENGWRLSISVITLMERLKGIANIAGDRGKMLESFEARIAKMRKESKIKRVYPVTQKVCKKAHQLLHEFCVDHTPPSGGRRIEGLICDMLIAATAIEHRLALFTHNRSDFEWIRCLKVHPPEYRMSEGC